VSTNHPDENYYGGSFWQMQQPLCHRYMVSSAGDGQFVLVTDPESPGSMLKFNEERPSVFFTLDELKSLFAKAEYLGEFYKCNNWRGLCEDMCKEKGEGVEDEPA
jgi:hypothetical protein